MKIAIKSCFTTLVEDTTLIQNAATPYPVEFAFSKDWDGFAKTALFEAGGVSMAVVLSEDKCDIPGECPEERRYPAEDRRLWRQGRGTEVDGLACDQQDPLPGQYQRWHRRLRRPDGR